MSGNQYRFRQFEVLLLAFVGLLMIPLSAAGMPSTSGTIILASAALLIPPSTSSSAEVVAEEHCPTECPECTGLADLEHCETTVLDPCGCCPVCVRGLGDECGTSQDVCEAKLICTPQTQYTATCQEPSSSSACSASACGMSFQPSCPDDSRLVVATPKEGECCGRPGKCECDLEKCHRHIPECEGGTQRVLVEEGGVEPGKCCDRYECRPQEPHCVRAQCPPELLDEDGDEECPEDSYRPATHVALGTCCPIKPGCRCRAAQCRPAVCEEGKTLRIIREGRGVPGRCCDQWICESEKPAMGKSCARDGKTYSDGEEWHSSLCEHCKCKKGVAVCKKMSCPKPPEMCTWIIQPEGECCPICVGCQTEKLEKKHKNETWAKDDCTTCTCSEEGTPICEKHMCRTECENPRKVEGQCCPVCDEPTILTLPATCPSLEHCPLRCENGLRRDDRGCFECECLPVDRPSTRVQCPTLSEDNCDKQCAHGYVKDNDGCVVCKCAKCPPLHQCFKHCLYGFEANAVGCPVCKCRAMSRIEAKLTIRERFGQSWDRCETQTSKGKIIERDAGEWWNDGCRHCFCEQKQEFCSLISCSNKPDSCADSDWVKEEGSCCPSCSSSTATTTAVAKHHEHTVCQSPGTGRLFTDGETWQLAACVSCTCRVGHVLCHTHQCPPIACNNPTVAANDQCCPVCPEDHKKLPVDAESTTVCTDEGGLTRKEGSSWRTDDCTSCTCTSQGKVECYREECEAFERCAGIPLVIKGRCCPVCSDALSSTAACPYETATYSVGEEWRDGDCTNCSCKSGGHTVCRQMVCPPCLEPVHVEGQCCPMCRDFGLAFSEGANGSWIVRSPKSSSGVSPLPLLGLSFMTLAIIGLLVLLLILYKRKNHSKLDRSLSKEVSCHLSKALGSQPQLIDWHMTRRESHSDGQSDSLLSTSSDTTTAMSSASSGTGPHEDTRPLTRKESSRSKGYPCNV